MFIDSWRKTVIFFSGKCEDEADIVKRYLALRQVKYATSSEVKERPMLWVSSEWYEGIDEIRHGVTCHL